MTSPFLAVWVVIVWYIALGKYLYFAKVLSVLRSEGLDHTPRLLPFAQAEQFRQASRVLRARGDRVWFLPLLNRYREITVVVAGLVIFVFVWVSLG